MLAPDAHRRPWFALATVVALAGCDPKARPWDVADAGSPKTEVPPERPPVRADAGVETSDASASVDVPETPVVPVRVGGPWVRCYGGFHTSGDPKKDLMRLALLCGPENGMHRMSKKGAGGARSGPPAAIEGLVSAGGPPLHDGFDVRRGDCFRIFAVAEPSVADLDVVVRSSRGSAIAGDHGEDNWPIVQPDRPFCALEDDLWSWEITAKRGAGRVAAEVWVLKAPPAKP